VRDWGAETSEGKSAALVGMWGMFTGLWVWMCGCERFGVLHWTVHIMMPLFEMMSLAVQIDWTANIMIPLFDEVLGTSTLA
jgi:hypothetical protein